MRAVSFVDRLEFDFVGNLFKNALTLGDVDNDGWNELIVGNASGELLIFKGAQTRPWRKSSDLGMITAVGVGDVFNIGRNALVVICGDGWCHIFHFENEIASSGCRNEGDKAEKDKVSDSPESLDSLTMKPVHTQRIPANSKVLLLGDVNGDGFVELVIGLTDRVVRSYHWAHRGEVVKTKPDGKLVGLNKWEFASQIGSVTLNQMADGSPSLLVAQPGGTFIRLKCHPTTERQDMEQTGELLSKMSIDYHPLASARMRNPNVSTEILGNIKQGPSVKEGTSSPYAVATLDGTLMLVQDEEITWSLQVDHQLFVLTKLDITGDGKEEVIVCSWDGQTYIVNHEKQSVRFQFEDNVCTFCAGYYTLSAERTVPCLIYATFNNKIYVYYNVQLSRITTQSFIDAMATQEGLSELLSFLSVEPTNRQQLQQLYQWCLYGFTEKT